LNIRNRQLAHVFTVCAMQRSGALLDCVVKVDVHFDGGVFGLGLRFSGLFFFISLCLKDFRELRPAVSVE